MPKTDFTGVTAADPNGSSNAIRDAGAGGYVCRVTKCYPDSYTFKTRQGAEVEVLQARLVFDIAAGDFQGKYDDDWGRDPDNDWAHSVCIRYDTGAAKLLGILDCLSGDAKQREQLQEAWNSDDWEKFVGCTFGLAAGAMHFTNSAGYDHVRPDWRRAKWHTVGEIVAGKYEVPGDVDRNGQPLTAEASTSAAVASDDDIPF